MFIVVANRAGRIRGPGDFLGGDDRFSPAAGGPERHPPKSGRKYPVAGIEPHRFPLRERKSMRRAYKQILNIPRPRCVVPVLFSRFIALPRRLSIFSALFPKNNQHWHISCHLSMVRGGMRAAAVQSGEEKWND